MRRTATLRELSRGILAGFVLLRILALTAFNHERSTFCLARRQKIRDPMRGPFGSLTALLSKT